MMLPLNLTRSIMTFMTPQVTAKFQTSFAHFSSGKNQYLLTFESEVQAASYKV